MTERRPPPISPTEADAAIQTHIVRLATETRPLARSIGRILRRDVFAERENPPFDRVCMDGVALASRAVARGVRRFTVQGTQSAGAPAVRLAGEDLAVEVMTGAVLPEGTDCVIPHEEYALDGGVVTLGHRATAKEFRNVQRRGEDSRLDVPMLTAGTRLGATEIAAAASAGGGTLEVSREPSIMAISTGDELVEPGEPIADHQIRRSNSYAIVAALRTRGFEAVDDDHLRDDRGVLTERLGQHLASHDLLVLSGGVSKGKFDFVPAVLADLGVREIFYQVAHRPGMPMWFGIGPNGQAVFGLPGNPVSTLVCLIRYVIPALDRAMGASARPPDRLPLGAPLKFHRSMTYFLPVAVEVDAHGRPVAMPRPPNGPGDFLALTTTRGFIELPPQPEPFSEGFSAAFYPW